MGLLDLISAYAIAQGSHTGGHFDTANKQGVPMHLDGFEEVWKQPDIRKDIDINGAGFQAQDNVVNRSSNKDASLVSALIKGAYLAGVPGMLNKNLDGYGDINNMVRESGNKYVPHMIGLTSLSDMMGYMNPDRNWSLGFSTFGTGQPGLLFNYRW